MAEEYEEMGFRQRLKRTFWATIIFVVIFYVGVHMLTRTEGFRTLVIDKISNGTRLPVAMVSCGATPSLGLKLKGLDFYGVQTDSVRVKINFFAFLSKETPWVKQLDIEALRVHFKRGPSGNWEPLVLHDIGHKLGGVLGVNEVPTQRGAASARPQFPPHVINAKTLLQLHNAKVVWSDEHNPTLALISNVDLSVKAGLFIDRKVVQTRFKSDIIQLASGKNLGEFQLESFKVEGSDLVMVLNMSDVDGEYGAFATPELWQDLNMHLDSLSKL